MDRAGKLYQDEMTVEKYRQRLQTEKKYYGQVATAKAANQRRSRGLALGEAALQIMDAARVAASKHHMIPGTLCYMLDEQVIYPTGDRNRKEFLYKVEYQVQADEPAYNENEIKFLCEDLEKKLKLETDEMFPEEPEKESEQ